MVLIWVQEIFTGRPFILLLFSRRTKLSSRNRFNLVTFNGCLLVPLPRSTFQVEGHTRPGDVTCRNEPF